VEVSALGKEGPANRFIGIGEIEVVLIDQEKQVSGEKGNTQADSVNTQGFIFSDFGDVTRESLHF